MSTLAAYYTGNRTIRCEGVMLGPPGRHEVQLDVSHCGVCGTDLHIFMGHMDQRVQIPEVIGHEMSGRVRAIGQEVDNVQAGDRVVVRPLDPCGNCPACQAGHTHICHNLKFIGIDTPGAFQQRWNVPAHTLHMLPSNVSFERGALVEPLAVACHDVRLGEVKRGEYVVVIGGGPIGMLVALVAQRAGAQVLVSEVNPFRVSLAKGLGLEAVNPAETDLLALVGEQTCGAGADVVFEVSGSASGAKLMTQLPCTRGRIVIVSIFSSPPPVDLFRFFWRELQLCGARVYEAEDFERAIRLASGGELPLDGLITSRFPLTGLQEALERVESGAEEMKTLIHVGGE